MSHYNKINHFISTYVYNISSGIILGKENTVLRAKVPEMKVSVIPNAVDTAYFTPNPINRETGDKSKYKKEVKLHTLFNVFCTFKLRSL